MWCCCFQRFCQVVGEAVGSCIITLRCTNVSGERVTSTISATNSKAYFEHLFHDVKLICFDGVLKMFEQDFLLNTVESLMSDMTKWIVSFLKLIVLSIAIFVANTCSVVDLFFRYAALVMGVS